MIVVIYWTPLLRSYLCLKCRALGAIREADLTQTCICREHLAEERINEMLALT